ncbi:MAG: VTC domain-containing protein [bacterium]|nr:VTC domain-containing protein [bacterium]
MQTNRLSNEILKSFKPITLGEVGDSLFKNRYDTKYLFQPQQLPQLLEQLVDNYRILEVENRVVQDYESLYFDNDKFKFYMDHHNGKLNRYKVRYRKYGNSRLMFIEIKFKNNKSRTQKWREKIDTTNYAHQTITDKETMFIDSLFHYNPGELFPRFLVGYSRMSLFHKEKNEKLTLDWNLSYTLGEDVKTYKNLVIAEVKQARPALHSEFSLLMRGRGISPVSFSKYCFGISRFYGDLKQNRIKPGVRLVEETISN